ncbi:MAG: phenylacetate-CoA oxygenase subunit PaaC [Actinobacteria bacterium]|nr:phenylacetate-CoA oxygenase subunit PaaC [Actinomycetota bacterium]MDQ3533808.1 phenylacetate-CoA oxygenase subunit PaaC [Actinomycetota bacterium]
MTESLVAIVTALGDDELILGHRHAEWTGFAPHIEEDVAFSSIAQDEIGHAAAYYSIASSLTGLTRDALALGRSVDEYRHAVLCERPNSDWAYTITRQWLYDRADCLRLTALEESAHDDLRHLATKIRREERYHLIHADMWMERIAHGPIEGRTKLTQAATTVLSATAGLFEPFEREADAIGEGWLTVPSEELGRRFVGEAVDALDGLGLPAEVTPDGWRAEFVASSSGDLIATDRSGSGEASAPAGLGGRSGRHSPDFSALWADMTRTYRADPEATW